MHMLWLMVIKLLVLVIVLLQKDEEIRKLIKHVKDTDEVIIYFIENELYSYPLDVVELMSSQSIKTTYNKFKELFCHVEQIDFDEVFLTFSFDA